MKNSKILSKEELSNLTSIEIIIINYLIGKQARGKCGKCYVKYFVFTHHFKTVKVLEGMGVVELVNISGNVAEFKLSAEYENIEKIQLFPIGYKISNH
jgi:hypothetical protein